VRVYYFRPGEEPLIQAKLKESSPLLLRESSLKREFLPKRK